MSKKREGRDGISYYKIAKVLGKVEFTRLAADKKNSCHLYIFWNLIYFKNVNILPEWNTNYPALHARWECSDIKITLNVGGSGKLAQDIHAGSWVQLKIKTQEIKMLEVRRACRNFKFFFIPSYQPAWKEKGEYTAQFWIVCSINFALLPTGFCYRIIGQDSKTNVNTLGTTRDLTYIKMPLLFASSAFSKPFWQGLKSTFQASLWLKT